MTRLLSACVLALMLAGCGGAGVTTSGNAPRALGAPVPQRRLVLPRTVAAVAPQPAQPSPGSLPQTAALPLATTAGFHAEMDALWSAVVSDNVATGMPAFFPEGAYAQVKAISDPVHDWNTRLVGGYALDIGAAHALLAAAGGTPRLLGVNVPAAYAHWVPPGVCYNGIGYWEVPNSRILYTQGGVERSFGIASMISWRGVWYVVHFGAVLRAGAGGIVDDPALGPGVSVNSGTC